MTCQCYVIGGPFIAEDPECLIHGTAAQGREEKVDRLVEEARETEDVAELRRIIGELADTAINL